MKKIILALCAIFCVVTTQAQEHMTFKGVSMGCDLMTFVSRLKDKGCTVEFIQDDCAVLMGNFAGSDSCSIGVFCTAKSKQVWKVIVYFPEKTSWFPLKSEYKSLKESYTAKYGTPKSYETFSCPYEDGDGCEMMALAAGLCKYFSFFETSICSIMLGIDETKRVGVTYEDKLNVEVFKKEKQAIVSSDI